jgi:hypothetical protein
MANWDQQRAEITAYAKGWLGSPADACIRAFARKNHIGSWGAAILFYAEVGVGNILVEKDGKGELVIVSRLEGLG